MNTNTPLFLGLHRDPLLVGTDFSLLNYDKGVTATSTASTALDTEPFNKPSDKKKLGWLNPSNLNAFSGLLTSVSQVVQSSHQPVPEIHNHQHVADKAQEKAITQTVVTGIVIIVLVLIAAVFVFFYKKRTQ